MKAFLGSLKGKIILGIGCTVVVAAVVVALVIILGQGYRTIVVDSVSGNADVTRDSQTTDAIEGQHLKDGDDVKVGNTSSMVIKADSDKYFYAEENAHFWIEAKGSEKSSKTTIRQDDGAVVYRIDKKLNEGEFFDVKSCNASMSVRGTVFRISCYSEGTKNFTKIEVFEGEVFVEAVKEDGDNTGKNRILRSGEMAIISSDDTESDFVEDEAHNVVMPIRYGTLPQGTAVTLGIIIDDGRDLSITKELIFDYTGISEHIFVKSDKSTEPTAVLNGNFVEVCSVCGIERETEIPAIEEEKTVAEAGSEAIEHPSGEHEYSEYQVVKPATADSDGEEVAVCSVCGERITRVIPKIEEKHKHEYKADANHSYPATCEKEGQSAEVCSICGALKTKALPKLDHVFVADAASSHAATCTKEGVKAEKCSLCGMIKEETIAKAAHNYVADSSRSYAPTCEVDGRNAKKCTKCDEVVYTVVEKTGHDFVKDPSNSYSGSCTRDGQTADKCLLCGKVVTHFTSSSSGHSYELDSANSVAATCTKEGKNAYKCSNCGDTYSETTGKAEHNYRRDGQLDRLATCTADGRTDSYVCQVCYYVKSTVVPKTGHSLGGPYNTSDSTYHKATCSLCSNYFDEAHDNAGSVRQDMASDNRDNHIRICSKCLETYYEPHSFNEATGRYEAGTETNMEKHIKICSDCRGYYGNYEPCTYGPWQQNPGDSDHYRICTKCNGRSNSHTSETPDANCTICNP